MELLRRLRRDTRGLAMLEFALSLPLVVPIGMYGIEISNYALTQMRLSQITLALADNASRVGADTSLNTQELREFDVGEVFQGVLLQGDTLDIGTNGRITLSSLEMNAGGGQYIHWQRCIGEKEGAGWDSSYGNEGDGKDTTTFAGMGEPRAKVTAPAGSAVMFVELNYQYQPLISDYMIGSRNLKFIASFIVRDNRDLSKGVTNPEPAWSPMICTLHNRDVTRPQLR